MAIKVQGNTGFGVEMKRHLMSLIFILLISLGLYAAGCKVGVGEVRDDEDNDSVPRTLVMMDWQIASLAPGNSGIGSRTSSVARLSRSLWNTREVAQESSF